MSKKLLLVDGTAITQQMKGVGLYAYHLCKRLPLALGVDWSVCVFTFPGGVETLSADCSVEIDVIPTTSDFSRGLYWTPKMLRKHRPDALLRPMEGVGTRRLMPVLTVCHDIPQLIEEAAGDRQSFRQRATNSVLDKLRARAMQSDTHVFCNSEYLKGQVSHRYGIEPEKMSVAYCGIEDLFFESEPAKAAERVFERFNVSDFILTFATGDNRENFRMLPEIVAQTRQNGHPTQFVIAGIGSDQPYVEDLRLAFSERDLLDGRDYIFVPFIPAARRQELAELYAAAKIYLELSGHEAFGMQFAEALAAGTRCIAASRAALPEVGGEFAVFVDDVDAASFAKAIDAVIGSLASADGNAFANKIRRQKEFAKRYSWDRTSEHIASQIQRFVPR